MPPPLMIALRLVAPPTPKPPGAPAAITPAMLRPSAATLAPLLTPIDIRVPPADRATRQHASLPAQRSVPQRTAGPRPPAQAAGQESRNWQDLLSAWLQAHRVYPEAARRSAIEGSPAIRFTVARDGRVTSVSLVHGSGSAVLDAAAIGLLENATVPALPKTFPETVTVTISLRYTLRG